MTSKPVLQTVAIALALSAAFLSFNLLEKHITGKATLSFVEEGCGNSTEAGSANCGAVLESPYAYWPPKFDGGTPGKLYLPVALGGLVYYSVLAVWLLGVGSPSPTRWYLHLAPMALNMVGLMMSGYFMFIMFRSLEQWCPWCVVTHVMNFLLFATLVFMWPSKAEAAAGEASSSEGAQTKATPRMSEHPTPWWRVVMTGLTMFGVLFGEGSYYLLAKGGGSTEEIEQYKKVLAEWQEGAGLAGLAMWALEREKTITLRSDDPTIGGKPEEQQPLRCVVFSDFECVFCQRFARLFEESVQPLFGGHLQLVFKNFPLDSSCNPNAQGTKHANACKAAEWADAARALGGNELFKKAHDYLFENRTQLARLTLEQFAAEMGIEIEYFREEIASDRFEKRLIDEGVQVRSLAFSATPAVFVQSRIDNSTVGLRIPVKHVRSGLVGSPGYWDSVASWYWSSLDKIRPPKTRLQIQNPAPQTEGPNVGG